MKGIRGKITRKIKSISTITSLKQSLLFQENLPNKPSFISPSVNFEKESNPPNSTFQLPATLKEEEEEKQHENEQQDLIKTEEEVKVSTQLHNFKENCPPGGNESIVFYTTSLRGIRKTFEDCNRIRFFLESFKVLYDERDVSMHMEYREELWRIMGCKVIPPKLFIRGRYIGGADEVEELHESGNLLKLFKGIPTNQSKSCCSGCAGMRFGMCIRCNGSRKIAAEEREGVETAVIKCFECNENGLVKCLMCTS